MHETVLTLREHVRRLLPRALRRKIRSVSADACGIVRGAATLVARRPAPGQIRVYYGHGRIPGLGARTYGGIVKFQYMQDVFPNSPWSFNVLYIVSSRPPAGVAHLARLARLRGARVVINQNGVGYPAWAGEEWRDVNRPIVQLFGLADHVFFQSDFCRASAERFVGRPRRTWEVLHNPVDTTRFTPAPRAPSGLVLMLGGTQYQWYRIETALHVLRHVRARRADARMIVTGALTWRSDSEAAARAARSLAADLGVADAVDLMGPYTQADAPSIFRRAHVLLHTKYNDPCPGVVLEALASGLPVVYSRSGGVPELVGPEAGIGIDAELSWERDIPPDPAAMAEAVLAVADERERYADAARQRAVDQFDLRKWLARHREVFEALT